MAEILPVEVAIIGAGPAGAAAAVQLKRYGLSPLVFEKESVGGLLRNANLVENYPGFPGGISGPDLIERITQQVQDAGVEPIFEEVTCLDFLDGAFRLDTSSRTIFAARVIAATGTLPKHFSGFEIPAAAQDRAHYEVSCLRYEKNRRILIVGAGDAAFDYALNLAKNDCRVTILNRTGRVTCLPLLWERAAADDRISYREGLSVSSISQRRDGSWQAVCTSGGDDIVLGFDHLIFAIGRRPQLDFLSNQVRLGASALEAAGLLYFIGDVKNDIFRQTAIAAGDGVMAAMQIARQMEDHKLIFQTGVLK
jgi:thioredoxin reductase (NADPH)